MTNNKHVILALTSLILSPFLFFAIGSFFDTQAALEEGILVSPVIIDEIVAPGKTINLQLKVTSGEDQDLFAYVVDFAPDPRERGTPTFVAGEGEKDKKYSLSSWVRISSDPFTFEANEKMVIPFQVVVPQNAEPGSHFGALILSTVSETSQDSGVSVSGEVGTLVLLRVKGNTKENGKLESFSKDKSWYQSPPINFNTRFFNSGNVHLRPVGNIEIFSIFGKKVSNISVNENLGSVLPESYRQFDNVWDPNHSRFIPIMGKFKARLLLTYAPGKTAVSYLFFWVIPYKWLLVVLAIFVIIALAVFYVSKNFKLAKR